MDIDIIKDLLIIFSLAVFVVLGFHKLKVPAIVGFLITGIIVGPHCLGLIHAVHEVELMSEIGVILLLFSIGTELSIKELIRLKKPVFLGGAAQVGLSILAGVAVTMALGMKLNQAVMWGFMLALSSTAIVLNLLQSRAELESPYGRLSLSFLIFQDLIIVPMMLVLPFLAGVGENALHSAGVLLIKTVGILGLAYVAARFVVPFFLRMVLRTKSKELFLLTILSLCFAVAFLTHSVGLSLSLGAFLAGLIVSESEFSLTATEGVIPFKEVFTSLFFISIGMLLDVGYALEHFPLVILGVVLVICLKAPLVALASALVGYPFKPSLTAGLALFQIGEFSFVLAKSGLSHKLISPHSYQMFLAVSVVTMAATPFAIRLAPAIVSKLACTRLAGFFPKNGKAPSHEGKRGLDDHLIVVGYGVGGQNLARAAQSADIGHVIIEMNPDTVSRARREGVSIFFGDATYDAVLEYADIEKARVLAVVIPDPVAARRIIHNAVKLNPCLHIVVRTRFVAEIPELASLGAHEVISEDYESSIEVFKRVLAQYMVPVSEIDAFTAKVRRQGYELFRSVSLDPGALTELGTRFSDLGLRGIKIQPGAKFDGITLEESGLRKDHGLTIVAVKRDHEMIGNPGGDFTMRAGDVAYMFGSRDVLTEKFCFFRG